MERQPGIESRETTILIVDDDPNNLAMLASFLGEHNLNILVAEDSENALQRAIYTKPDLILMDIRMPKMDGYELCRRLKEMDDTRDIPVIFMTALTETEYKVKGFKAGAVDYVTKPFQREEVLARVSIHLRNRELTNKLQEEKDLLERRVGERTRDLQAAFEKRGELEFIINHSPAVAWLWKNEKGWPVEYVSKNLAIYGYIPDDFINGRVAFASIVHPEDLPRVAAEVERYVEEGRTEFTQEYRILTKSGEVRWFDDSTWVRRNADGLVTHYQGTTVDITRRKQAEEKVRTAQRDLQKFNEQLEQMVIKRTEELQRVNQELVLAREAAQTSSRAKGEFLASMSHEIRTPLNAILGFSKLLQKEELTHSAKQNLEIINRSGEHLLSLINNILELAKIESGRISLKPSIFDMQALISDIEMMFRERTGGKGLSLNLEIHEDTPRYVTADAGKVRQVFINLLGNAVKFTRKGGITVRVRPERIDGAMVIAAEVEDTGEGIAPEEIGKLFGAFEQTASGIRSHQGTGLGLAITRQYLNLMGGDINAASEPGKGTCFRLHFPVQVAQEPVLKDQQKLEITGLRKGQGAIRVLVVDDHEEQRNLILSILGSIGFKGIKEASNGKEAVRIHSEWKPRIIMMDLNMPEMDGFGAVRKIRESDGNTYVIAVTANVLQGEREKVIAAGFNSYVQKPYKEEEIIRAIEAGGIEFIRAGEEESCEEDSGIPIGAIPAELIEEIRKAAGGAEFERLTELFKELERHDPGTAKRLNEILMRFDYEMILKKVS